MSFAEFQVDSYLDHYPKESVQILEVFTRTGGLYRINLTEFFHVLHIEPALSPEVQDDAFEAYDWSVWCPRDPSQRCITHFASKWNSARNFALDVDDTVTFSSDSDSETQEDDIIVTPWSDSE